LERDLAHPKLAPLAGWFDEHTPKTMRNDVLEAIA